MFVFLSFKQFLKEYPSFYLAFFREEDEGEDEVDSDFSIDENDEPVSDVEQEGGSKKKRRLMTKAYKEPSKTVSVPAQSTPKVKKPKPAKRHRSSIDSTGL